MNGLMAFCNDTLTPAFENLKMFRLIKPMAFSIRVNEFFAKYFEIIYDENGTHVIPNSNIYNADESGFTIVHRPEKYSVKEKVCHWYSKQCRKGKTVTFLPALSAI